MKSTGNGRSSLNPGVVNVPFVGLVVACIIMLNMFEMIHSYYDCGSVSREAVHSTSLDCTITIY